MKNCLHGAGLALCLYFIASYAVFSQTPGLIYKPAGNALGRSVLDPNGDGYVSATSSGFVGKFDFGSGSELSLFPLPILENEPLNDLSTGAGGGHTDLASNDSIGAQSSYIGLREVGGTKYLIIRIRLGGASTASKGYSVLMNTTGSFSPGLLGSNNPGFDKEIVLETGNAGKVAIYTHTLVGGTPTSTLSHSFALNDYHQRSVAASFRGGNPDYFYDFFVPLNSLGIGMNDIVRLTATTITSASSGITGTISDFNGVDDKKYGNNRTAIMMAVINSFPGFSFNQMLSGTFSFGQTKTTPPVITGPLLPGNNQTVSGTSAEADGTTIVLYQNGTPVCTTTVTAGAWSCSSLTLAAGDVFKATASATGKSISDESDLVEVSSSSPCFVSTPQITSRANGTRVLSGTWSASAIPATTGSNITIIFYWQDTNGSFVTEGSTLVPSNGSWTFTSTFNQSDFSPKSYYARAVAAACTSGYSNVSIGNTGTTTTAPTIETSPVYEVVGSQNISIKNNHSSSAVLILFNNGTEIARTSTGISAGLSSSLSVSGLREGDTLSARAQGTAASSWLSNLSNKVGVQLNAPAQSTPPVITGTYYNGSGISVNGTSLEAPGTVITLYKKNNGNTLIGTVTVTQFYTWQVTGLTLVAGDTLLAFSKPNNKSLSLASNQVKVLNASSKPNPPVITGSYFVNANTVNGDDANNSGGTITVYVDGEPIGSFAHSNPWSLGSLPAGVLFKGAKISATNTAASGEVSNLSNEVTVSGITSFRLIKKDSSGIPPLMVSGDAFPFVIEAKDAGNGGGTTVTAYTGNPTVIAEVPILNWEGQGDNANSGVVGSANKNLYLGGHGSNKKIRVIDPEDPSAVGEATITIVRAYWKGTSSGTNGDEKKHNQSGNWTHNRVPYAGADIAFDPVTVEQDMVLDASYAWGDLDFSTNVNPNHGKKVVLGGHNLTVNSISNRGSSYIVTNGTGQLKRRVGEDATVEFPIGPDGSRFLPVTIKNRGFVDDFSVRIKDTLNVGATTGVPFTSNHVAHTWFISRGTAVADSGVDLTFTIDENKVVGTLNNPTLLHYVSGSWIKEMVTNTPLPPAASGVITQTFTDYLGSFSPFGIDDTDPLPIQLLSFSGICEGTMRKFNWKTASEINNQWFYIEESADLVEWKHKYRHPGGHTSSSALEYEVEFYEQDSNEGPYYRLVQEDFDGSREVFAPIAVQCGSKSLAALVYPNPSTSWMKVVFADPQSKISMLDINGRVWLHSQADGSGHAHLDISSLPSGVYTVLLSSNQEILSLKAVVIGQ